MNTNVLETQTGTSSEENQKFLSFAIGEETYGVEILRVREIIGLIDITPLPQTPDYVKGVINLRGKIIPVLELRSKFGMNSVDYTEETCVIVVDVSDPDGQEQFEMGVIVDAVNEVLDIEGTRIEPPPKFGFSLNTDFILGMGKIKLNNLERVIILLDIDRVMTAAEMNAMAQTGTSETTTENSSDTPEPLAA